MWYQAVKLWGRMSISKVQQLRGCEWMYAKPSAIDSGSSIVPLACAASLRISRETMQHKHITKPHKVETCGASLYQNSLSLATENAPTGTHRTASQFSLLRPLVSSCHNAFVLTVAVEDQFQSKSHDLQQTRVATIWMIDTELTGPSTLIVATWIPRGHSS